MPFECVVLYLQRLLRALSVQLGIMLLVKVTSREPSRLFMHRVKFFRYLESFSEVQVFIHAW
jgi:hypothetical protein